MTHELAQHEVVLRYVLLVQGLGASALFAAYQGRIWREARGRQFRRWTDGWPSVVAAAGGIGVLIYVGIIQAKALDRRSPFDEFSWTGLIATTLVNIGLSVLIWRSDRRRG